MSVVGKIFLYESNPVQTNAYKEDLAARGFFAFSTDNLYTLLKYAEEVRPDIVIMNLPENFAADSETWKGVEQSLCRCRCPQIYINSRHPFKNKSFFHYYNFNSGGIEKEQVLDILKNPETRSLPN